MCCCITEPFDSLPRALVIVLHYSCKAPVIALVWHHCCLPELSAFPWVHPDETSQPSEALGCIKRDKMAQTPCLGKEKFGFSHFRRVRAAGMSLSCAGWGCWAGCFTWTLGRREGSLKGFTLEETVESERTSLLGARGGAGLDFEEKSLCGVSTL